MESQRGSVLGWAAYYCHGKTMEELRQSLLYTTLELEQTRLIAQEELRKREDQLIHLKDLLSRTIREKDDAQEKCQRLLLEKLILQHQQQLMLMQHHNAPLSGISSIEDEPRKGVDSNNGFSSSDCEESIVSSPAIDAVPQPPQLPRPQPPPAAPVAPTSMTEGTIEIVPEKPLPEKGKLLQAVMKAGPLLQTLLLAGPLPQWRHPPPPLEPFEIPPVTIPSPSPPPPQLTHQDPLASSNSGTRKRVLFDGFDSATEARHQRIALH